MFGTDTTLLTLKSRDGYAWVEIVVCPNGHMSMFDHARDWFDSESEAAAWAKPLLNLNLVKSPKSDVARLEIEQVDPVEVEPSTGLDPVCKECGARFARKRGMPATYCSGRCRQRAHRARNKS